jgi:Fe-S-cluster containining protein
MVVNPDADNLLLQKVDEIYNWLDLQISSHSDLAGICDACGRCCNFESFDHRLFVTTPEVMYLSAKLCGKDIKPMTTSRCPYQTDGKCTVYKSRFAGCRIFCCKADKDFQSSLSESAIKKFKSLCTKFQIPYRYTDLATTLSDMASCKIF